MYSVARRIVDTAGLAKAGPPKSARALAGMMKSDPNNAIYVAYTDFEAAVKWNRELNGHGEDTNNDAVRETLRRRVEAVKSALPGEMAHMASEAFMHIEHEVLKKTYVNTETMYGDPITSIVRSDFWASEDGYAWDMTELVQAISAKKGAMRNPLSLQNFTVADVEAITRHPIGKHLAALQVKQSQLYKGVRQETITRLRAMSKILVADNSETSHPSHQAVDEFLSYVATLPENERKAIDNLRVPAVDSHSGQPFDDTIGDAVRDAKAHRICFHKAGDLLGQAALFLSKKD